MHTKLIETKIGNFWIDIRDQFVAKSLSSTGEYSPGERHLYSKFITQNSNVLWLGAHIGALVIPFSKYVQRVDTFEANPETYRLLKKNLMLNGCNNVNAFNIAANDVAGKLNFICNTVNSGGSKRTPHKMNKAYLDTETKLRTVQCVDLDSFLSHHDYDFIFMDIEGSETHAMRGMSSILKNAKTLVVEFIPHHLTNVANVTPKKFLLPLQDFKTMVVPSLRRCFYGNEIEPVLNVMFNNNACDPGLIFHKNKIVLNWS
jgi:FkbM family methyltransferase